MHEDVRFLSSYVNINQGQNVHTVPMPVIISGDNPNPNPNPKDIVRDVPTSFPPVENVSGGENADESNATIISQGQK